MDVSSKGVSSTTTLASSWGSPGSNVPFARRLDPPEAADTSMVQYQPLYPMPYYNWNSNFIYSIGCVVLSWSFSSTGNTGTMFNKTEYPLTLVPSADGWWQMQHPRRQAASARHRKKTEITLSRMWSLRQDWTTHKFNQHAFAGCQKLLRSTVLQCP